MGRPGRIPSRVERLVAWLALLQAASCVGPLGDSAGDEPSVAFGSDLEAARREAAVSGKPIVLVFGAVWCASCQAFRAGTLTDGSVRALQDDFEWVAASIDRDVALAREYDVRATPQVFVLDRRGRVVAEAIGSLPPGDFRPFLEEARRRAAASDPDELPPAPPVEAADLTPVSLTSGGYRAASVCYSHVGYGPLALPSQAPTSVLRLSPQPRAPSTLTKGQHEVRLGGTLSNFWSFEPGLYRLDYGALYSTLSVAYGWTDTVQIEAQFSDYRRFDSVLDPVTNAFHDLFGLDDSGRDDFPTRENVIQVESVNSVDDSTYTEDLTLTVQHNVTCGTETLPAFAYSVSVRTNVSGNIPVRRDPDLAVGLSASASRRVSDEVYAYLGLGFVWNGLDQWRGIDLARTQYSALTALEWRYDPRSSWVVQYLWTQPVSEVLEPLDDWTHEISLGWKTELDDGYVVEVGLLENAFVVDSSPDFGFHLALSRRF